VKVDYRREKAEGKRKVKKSSGVRVHQLIVTLGPSVRSAAAISG
jgi:hypothetical protein